MVGNTHNFCECHRVFVDGKDEIEVLDNRYVDYFPQLYTKLSTKLTIALKCGTAFGNKCANPTTSIVIVEASLYQV